PINGGNVVFGDNNKGKIIGVGKMMDSLNLDGEEKLEESKEENPSENDDQVPIVETTQEQQSELPKNWRTVKDHPLDNVIGEITKGVYDLNE
ncbi:hypothetical protein PIB30_112846, partial [Stylosanthes scabra]|nr:hypothetical protein [Stylosanthes scabra]